MLTANKSRIRVFIVIAMFLLFFSALQSATACETCDVSCSCTDCSGCPDCGCVECNPAESTEKENSNSISNIFNGSTLSLGDGIHTNFTKISIDKDITIQGNGVNNSIIFIDSNNVAFNVLSGNTLKLYNLTIFTNYIYSDGDIANFNSLVNLFNGSIAGSGTVVFENCKFINNKKTDVVVTVSASPTYNSNRITLTANVNDFNGNNLIGDVAFYINNEFSGRVSIANGVATYSVDLANGNYNVHASYVNDVDTNYGISQNQPSFNVFSLIQPLSVPLPTSGNRYWVDPSSGQDNASRNGLSIATAWRTILYAYNNAQANSSIILQPGIYQSTGNAEINLANKLNMTIIGNDTVNDVIIIPSSPPSTSSSVPTFLNISAGTSSANQRTLNLYNLIIRGGLYNKIYIQANNILNIDSLIFVNSTSGRGIYTESSYVDIIVNNSLFTNLTGSSTGKGIGTPESTVASFGSIRVNNTNFTNIAQASTGGVINHHGPSSSYVSLYNTNIINCTGSSVGAVIRCYGGAGVTLNYTNITDSGCTASSHGGIFCLNGAGSFLVTDNSRFTNVFSGGQGGVTFTHTGPSTIINTIFENCRSSNTGGVIHNAGTNPVTIINSSFIGNNATSGGAINAASSGSIAIFNSTFTNNRATSTTGGAIHAASGTVNITNSSFNNNFATTQGGAINVASGAVNIVGSNFTSNVATTFGGVIGSGGGTVSISTSNFNNNNATQYGGAIGASAGTINANLSNFNGNYVYGSGAYGGALGSPGGTINIYNSAFANNSARNNTAAATAYGGVAGVNGANAVITLVNCTVHDNWAKYGGAFGTGTSGGRINVINNTAIFNNYALEYGGVAGLGSAGTIIIENSRIYNNSAGSFGGAFGVNGAGTINATNSNLTGNDAGTYGGAVGVNGAGTVNLNFVEMIDNMAVNYGGAVALSGTGGTVNVRSSTLRRNHATGSTGYGGAIGLMSGNINVYDSRFENNTAVTYGGAVGVPTGGNFYANNSNFTDNVAGTYGGAIGSAAGVNITYCIFTRNEAGTFGGGVAAMGGSLANSILSCQFEYNYAGNQGYGVYAAGRLTANYNRFFNNTDASGNFNQTIWTNTSQSGNVNIDFNWWGENRHLAVGNLPNNYVVIDFDTVNYGLWNGSAHYVYTILLNDTTNTNFNVSRLPPFMGEARFIVPPYNTSFSAHLNGTVVSIPFVADAYHEGYFRVDNQYISFNVTTNSTPTVSNLTVNLGTTSGKYKDQVTLTATYLDNGGYPVAGLVVDFYVAGVYVGTNTTTANGTVYHSYTVASAGNLNYTVEYNGSNKNYNPINASTILNFLRLDTRIVVNNVVYGNSGAPVILNATIYDEWNDTIGNVTLHFYGMSGGYYTFALTNSNGQAIANYTFPVTGNYTWYAVFDGNGNYTASNSSTSSTGRADISPIVNLTINKNANVTGGVNFGDYVTYTINVTNHGPDAATNVIVLDLLNSSLILQSFTPSSGTYVSSTGLWTIASISVNQTVTLTINVRVNVTGTIPNVATITNVNQPNVGGNTSGVNISSSNAVNLTIVKSSNTSTAGYGDLVTYTINVTNHGPNTATAVSVYDQLDYRLILVNATATIGTYTNNVWSIPSIAAGGSAILTIIVRINGTGNITNLANITNVTEFNLANGTNSSNVNVSVPNTVNLTISKTSNVTGIVGVGDRVTYTINVTNHGPDNATFVNVTDRLSSALLFLNASATIGSYNNNTGVWTVGTLNVGQTATLYINVTIIGTGNIVNVANVTVREVNLGNNSTNDSVTLTVPSTVNFTITKTSNAPATVYFGDLITYTITVRNFGPDNATNVVVTDILDSRLIFVNAVGGNYSMSGNTLFWNISNLNVGSTVTLNITVRINGTGNIVNIANITASQDNIGENGTNSSSNGTNFTVPNTVNLTIVKSTNASANASYLDYVTYTINVTNFGPDTANSVSVYDRLDSRLILLSANATIGTYNPATYIWSIPSITAGQSAILNIFVRINGTGNITNVANITNVNEENLGNNSTNSTVNISVPSTVNLTISKTSNVTGVVAVGDRVTYTINVTNHGPDNATFVNVTDRLVSALLFLNASATIGSYNNNTGIWTIGTLNVGQTATLYINVSIIGTGNIVNLANVTVREVNLGNNSTNDSVTLTVPSSVNFTISKTSNASANVRYNDIITYTIAVRNYGPDNATGVIVFDELDYRLAYISHTASPGTNYTVSNGVWDIGSLTVGQNVTLTITVRINGTGNIVNVANITTNQDNIGENSTNSTTNGTNFTVPSTVNLTIVKTSNASANASYLDIVSYTVNVTNHGPDNATAVSVLDQIDSRLIVLNTVMNMGNYNIGTGMWDIGTIAAGTSAILTITVQINGTGNISNIANINNFNETINLNDTNNSTVNISVPSTVNLTIVKVSNVTGLDVGVGDLVAYTINVTNHGPDNATGVNVTDILSNRLLFLNATANIGIYNNNTGMWVINNLAVGQTATLTINVQVIGTGNIVNVANVTVNEVNLGNNSTSSNTTFSINSTVNFTISKTSNASASVRYNDIITYTITVRNFGPDNATGVIVIDRIDPRLAYLSHTTTVGTYTVSNGVWDIGNLAAGSTETLTITVRINGTGNIVNVANITSDQNNIGENSTNASSNSTNFTVPTTVNLTVVKTSNASANASYLDIVTYTINVTNHGPDNATAVSVLDVLDYRLALLNANMNLGNYNSLTGEWTIATIAAGQSAILTLTVQIIGTGNIANVANITNFTEEINLNDTNNSTVNITVPRTANVTVTKFSNITGNVTVGTSVLYTIRVTNNGPDNATNVNVTDVLDSRLTFVSASSSSYNPSTGIWSIGALNVGVTLELNITVIVSGTGQIVNVANVSISEVNIGNNSTDGNNSTVNVPASVNITITKNSNVTSNVIVGDLVSYTITVANNGPDNATGLVIIDQLDSRLIFVSASLANYNAANGRWTIGSLAVNQSLTLTINVRVNGTGNIPNIANVTVDQENIGQDNASSIPLGADHIPTSISVENVTQNATMPFTINGNVTSQNGWAVNGFVNITINGTVYSVPVTNGAFSLTNTYNEYGLYNDFTVEYFGDAAFAPSNTTNAWLNILPLSTTTIVNTSTALIFNFTTNITANLTDQFGRPVVGATVTFIVDGITIGTNITNAQGIAIHDFTPGPFPANYTLEATYAGNTTYLSSNDTITRQSRDMGTRITIADVTTKVNRLTEIPIYLHNEFDSPMPNQVIRVEIDGNVYNLTTNGQGIAYLYHTPTEANPLRIDAEFIGNPLLRRSEQMGVLLVEKLATEIVLDNVVVTTVENSTFTAVLKDEDGDLLNNTEVDVYIDGEYVGTFETDTYGRLYYTGPPLPKGDFTISVAFAGSGNVYAGTTSESTLTVRPLRTTTTVSASHVDNETTTFIARLYDEFNKPLADKPMAFFLDGMFIGIAITDFNGVARLNHTYTPGGSIVAEFLGDSIYRESLDNRPFGITPTSNITVDTNSTENDTVPDPIVQGDIDDDDFNYEYDDGDIDGDGTSRSTPLIAMSAAGNPIAMILLSLLAMLFIGLRRRKKN
ncbi:MAG: hypothetical protein FWH29_00135 [Methanobrevibacter sp.]|nr:hypothetical protein [Methanobrevibacter sp.]